MPCQFLDSIHWTIPVHAEIFGAEEALSIDIHYYQRSTPQLQKRRQYAVTAKKTNCVSTSQAESFPQGWTSKFKVSCRLRRGGGGQIANFSQKIY